GLARRLVAMCRCPVLVMPEGQRPHPRRPYRGRMYQNTTDYGAIGKHVVVILIPLAGGTRGRCAFEDQLLSHADPRRIGMRFRISTKIMWAGDAGPFTRVPSGPPAAMS